jgi:hypothetical protein
VQQRQQVQVLEVSRRETDLIRYIWAATDSTSGGEEIAEETAK